MISPLFCYRRHYLFEAYEEEIERTKRMAWEEFDKQSDENPTDALVPKRKLSKYTTPSPESGDKKKAKTKTTQQGTKKARNGEGAASGGSHSSSDFDMDM